MNFKPNFNAIKKFVASFMLVYFSVVSVVFASDSKDLFVVKNINVDVTSSNSYGARDKAMKKANRIAVDRVIKSLVLKSDLEKLPIISDEQLLNYISETSVVNEKTSSVRYIATLNIKINEKSLKKYLIENQVPFVLEIAPKSLVLPIFSAQGKKTILWENNNWFEVWKNNRNKSSLIPLIVPRGDFDDIKSVSANQAEVLNSKAIKNISDIYLVENVYVVNASYKNDNQKFEVYIQYLSDKNPFFTSVEFDVTPDMSEDRVLLRALELVQYEISDVWKKQNVISYEQSTKAVVVAKITSLADWLSIKSVINSLPFVKDVNLRAIKKGQAQFEMNFFGDKYRLISALEDEKLNLYEYGNIWVVERKDYKIGE
jgi:hypothetical protein